MPIDTTESLEFADETTTPEPTTTTTEPTTTTTTTLAPEIDREWEDLVLAGPTVVNYLGLFMVLASRNDSRLTKPAEYNFEYINNFTSLHAVLSQISSAMQGAFQVARDDLIRIRTSMEQIPEHINAGLILIKDAPNVLLANLLPYTLRNINRAASEASTVAKPTFERFDSVGLLLEELVILLNSTTPIAQNEDYFIEAKAYANDMKTQWDLLAKLFKKFSSRADITQQSITDRFSDPINEAKKSDGYNFEKTRSAFLGKLIPATIAIDQSSNLLDMMSRTYTDVSTDHMINQIFSNKGYLDLKTPSERAIKQRELWQNTVSQSVNVARLAQERHNEFAATSPKREKDYSSYLQGAVAS